MIGRGPGLILLLIPAKVRIPIAIGCFSIAGVLIVMGRLSDSPGETGWSFILSLPFLFTGSIMLVPTICSFFGEGLAGMVVPNKEFSRAQVMYGPIEALRLENAFEEAMDELEDVIAEYPDEVRAYILMMEIACTDLYDPDRVDEIYERAVEHMPSGKDRERLEKAYCFYAG